MRDEPPELYVPASERRPASNWRLTLLRLWYVVGITVAAFVLISGERALHFREALFTLAIWYAVGQVVGWIFRPALPPDERQR